MSTLRHPQPRDGHGRFTTRPSLGLVKPTGPAAPDRILSLVKNPPLPSRQPAATLPEHADHSANAAHAANQAGIPARILDWRLRPDGTAYQYLADGILLSHPGTYGAPVTAMATCAQGAAHAFLATSLRGLFAGLDSADRCPVRHADFIGQPDRPARNLADAFAARPTHATTRAVPLAIPLAIAKGEPR